MTDAENYAAADASLSDPGIQAAVARFIQLGAVLDDDEFLNDPAQLLPFLKR